MANITNSTKPFSERYIKPFFSLILGNFNESKTGNNVFIETENYEKGFADYYDKNIKPHISSFEKSRLQNLKKSAFFARILTLMTILTIILVSYVIWITTHQLSQEKEETIKEYAGFVIIILNILYIYIFYLSQKPLTQYRLSIKSKIFPLILSFIGKHQYTPTLTKQVNLLKKSLIIPKHNMENSEDLFILNYKDTEIKIFETKLQSNNGKTTKTVFQGIIIELSMNKNFNSQTIITKDYGKIFNILVGYGLEKLKRVHLEDPEFEEMFSVYSKDQIEARYLLTTSFMTRLLELTSFFKSKAIRCSFYDNKLLMMIPLKKNMFEPGSIFESENFIDDSKNLLAEIHKVFQIIDILKLDQNIGM